MDNATSEKARKTPIDISIDRIFSYDNPGSLRYKDEFVIMSNLTDMRIFSTPIRLSAITVFICLDGDIEGSVNLNHFHVLANNIMVNFPGDVVHVTSCSSVNGYAVILSEEYLKSLQLDFRLRTESYLNLRFNGPIEVPREELEYLMPYYVLIRKNVLEDNTEVIRSLSLALSHSLAGYIRRYRINRDPVAKISRAQLIFEKFMDLLQKYHNEERNLSFYAGKMCLTPKYISSMVKTYTGRGALDWINEYVMLEARMMLRYSDLTIQEISYHLNFTTQSAFGKYFRMQEGMSPRQYRQSR